MKFKRDGSKGQAAMEFLMTYGWAILVVLAAIGALAYFGVLNPQSFLPDTYIIGQGFNGGQFKASTNDIQFEFINNLGTDTKSVSWSFNTTGGSDVECNAGGSISGGLDNGERANVNVSSNGCGSIDANPGERVRAEIAIDYTKTGQDLSHRVTGEMNAEVEP